MISREEFPELWRTDGWASSAVSRQDAIIEAVLRELGNRFEYYDARDYRARMPIRICTLRDVTYGIRFNLLPGGEYRMGLSPGEQEQLQRIDRNRSWERVGIALSAMLPPHRVRVPPLLCARFPLLETEASNIIDLDDIEGRPEFGDFDAPVPLYLTLDEAGRVQEKTGFRLLSEAEWEYACRAGSTSLFYFGDTIPDGDLGKTICLTDFSDDARNERASNGFGLVGLATGEFCRDSWHNSHEGAPNDGTPRSGTSSVRVVRGGAAAVWPWQDSGEWLLLLSAMRVRSDHMPEGMAGVRLAVGVGEWEG